MSHRRSLERKYLGQLSQVLIKHLLPEDYSKFKLFNILAEDIATNLLLYPAIDALTDPDFINTRYLNIMRKYCKDNLNKESPNESSQRSWKGMLNLNNFCFENSSILDINDELSLENILMLINLSNSSTDEDTLKQVLKVLQQNLEIVSKLSDEVDDAVDHDDDHYHWNEILKELKKARDTCQMKLDISPESQEELSFDAVLENPTQRKYFSEYLETLGFESSQTVFSLWEAIENMRQTEKHLLHQVGTKIFYSYINRPVPALVLDKCLIRKVESFLLGDSGHQVCN